MTPLSSPDGQKQSLQDLYEEGSRLGKQKEMKAILVAEMKRRGLLKFPSEVYES